MIQEPAFIKELNTPMGVRPERRKCLKCGCTPSEDNVKLFKFPKPAIRNLERCTLWAKFVYPDKEYSSMALQMRLHNEHKMLCERHFKKSDFINTTKKIILRSAVPSEIVKNTDDKPIILNFVGQNNEGTELEA